jgi:hypothetical protein
MSSRYFLFMYPFEADVRGLLSLAIFALNPEEKWPAHVTVAGPFNSRPHAPAKFDGKVPAFCLGTGNFFRQNLSTVYLNIGVHNLRKIWRKPDFTGDPVPHLSLYNGKDRDFAENIFRELSPVRPYFSFSAVGLSVVKSVSGQSVSTLREQVDVSLLDETREMRLDQIRVLPSSERLQIAKLALTRCKQLRGNQRPADGSIVRAFTMFSGIKAGL